MKGLILILSILLSAVAFSQKDGKYLSEDSPVNQLWESVDGKDGGANIADNDQQFFFLIPDGSEGSMMAPFEMEGMGFACPTYFTVSLDESYLYIQLVGEPCSLELPEDERYIKVMYKMSADGKVLTLTVDGVEAKYKEWEG